MNLEFALKNCLSTYHTQNVRYRHLGFSSKSLVTLDKTNPRNTFTLIAQLSSLEW